MDYYQGYEDAMRQARGTRRTGLLSFLIRTIISVLYSAFIYVPLLILGYVISRRMSVLYSDNAYIKIALTLIIGYLLFALVYFLKGVVIGLRQSGRHWWLMLWLICVLVTCGIQAILVHSLFKDFFVARSVANYQTWSWLGATIVALLIYSHYQFLTNIAPSSVFWSYQLGFRTVAPTVDRRTPKPQKSLSYFDNAPMRVSFKRK